jgi:2-aminoadipate transaminase
MPLSDLFAERARLTVPSLYGPTPQSTIPVISLAYGLADPAHFPREELLAAFETLLAEDADRALNYAPPSADLTRWLIEHLYGRGTVAADSNLLLSYGSGQILNLLPEVLIEPGDPVIIEEASFLGAVHRFARAGATLISIPIDESGMDVDVLEDQLIRLERRGQRAKFIYTIPTFQNPTGTTMSLVRRQQLVALASNYGVLVVEDDAYGELRFGGETLPSLLALDADGWVLHVGTFSKILAPGLRLGWACGPQELIERLRMFKLDGGTSPFITQLVARYCEQGRLDTHIARLRAVYAHKCQLMLDAMRREFPPEVRYTAPEGGFFIWCELPPGLDANSLLQRSIALGADFLPGPRCYAEKGGQQRMRLAFSHVPSGQIDEAIARIGAAMKR